MEIMWLIFYVIKSYKWLKFNLSKTAAKGLIELAQKIKKGDKKNDKKVS
ncbi:hypothetical protein J2S10_000779 [Neobacillus ginsengisoli]|uniref:Uncharacterized protein n=1 Tax=Neobacillus ginsengisoli TaxID=904295 RepID=A0ABT9XQ48_9BACI|nr:hypothetical protein [Neobacillus ginsengisoli]